MASIKEKFEIAGKGTVVLLDEATEFPVGVQLRAHVSQPDGSKIEYRAWKEWLLRRGSKPSEYEAFLLIHAETETLPIGATVMVAFIAD